MSSSLLIKNGRIIDPSQKLDAIGDLLIIDGKVAAVKAGKGLAAPQGVPTLDAKGSVVTAGFVDLHCHLREPGFEEKETIATGTLAAARGGFTTICCMPNTNPALDSRSSVEFVLAKAKAEGVVRVLPIGAVTKAREGHELAQLAELAEAGVVAFSDDGSPVADAAIMRNALSYAKAWGLPITDHCEEPSLAKGGVMHEGRVATRLGLKGMPAAAEEAMVARDISLAELTGSRVHIAHASTAGSVELVRRAKERGLPVTAEVTPHHLTLSDSLVEHRDGKLGPAYDTNCKVNPPLRGAEHVAACVAGLAQGVFDAIATDHAPHTIVDKQCEFDLAAFGISNFETALGSVLSLVHSGVVPLSVVVERLTCSPGGIADRQRRGLGTLQVGAVGDVALIDLNAAWTVEAKEFASKGKNTPLDGHILKGRVVATVYGGAVVHSLTTKGAAHGR